MNKPKDFSTDLEILSQSVESEVGTIIEAIKENKAKQSSPPDSSQAATTLPGPSEHQSEAQNSSSERTTDFRRSTPGRMRPRQRPTLADQVEVLHNVTTRLRRDTNELLTEAALKQRLRKELPASRQDIVEDALREWFRRRGYLNERAD